MKFCAKCGTKLEMEQHNCHHCGYDLSSRQNNVIKESVNSIQSINETQFENDNEVIVYSKPQRKNSVLSMRTKLSIVGICIAAISLTAFFMIGNSLSKPSKIVSSLEKNITSDNKAELINILYCDDNRLQINEKSIAPLLSYFKDNPSFLNTLMHDLKKEAFKVEQTNSLFVASGNNTTNILSLTYTGKKFLFFPSYKISIKPAFIQVKTGIKDVVLSLNGTEIGKSNTDNYSKEFGPFIPGKYKILANYKGNYVDLSEPHDVDLITASNCRATVDIFTTLNYLKVRSEYPEAELFVNGKDTGVKAMDTGNFGPLNAGTKVYGTLTNNGKKLKSDEYTVSKGDSDIYLNFREAENRMKNVENQLHDLIYWYTYYFTEAVNTNNFSSVEYYLYPGSKLYSEQQSYIPATYNKGIKETIMSFNITSYNINEDNTSGTITTEEVYTINDTGKSSVNTYKYKYTFRYNEAKKRYQLDSISDIN